MGSHEGWEGVGQSGDSLAARPGIWCDQTGACGAKGDITGGQFKTGAERGKEQAPGEESEAGAGGCRRGTESR